MPQGSLVPQDVKKKISMFEKFMPKEIVNQFKTLSEAERSFVIPIRLEENGQTKYLIVAGMLLKNKVPVQISFDEEDLELIRYALEKAEMAIKTVKNNNQKEDKKDEQT